MPVISLSNPRSFHSRFMLVATLAAVLAACGSGEKTAGSATLDTGTGTPPANEAVEGTPLMLSATDLDGFEKGIEREIELVRAASDRASKASTPQERGEAIQAGFETNTIAAASPVTGLSADRYELVRETLSRLLTTLDFQGQIDGPQSLDTSRADAAMKARLASDPYDALDPAGAAALKERLPRIVPLWVQYVNLTAVGG